MSGPGFLPPISPLIPVPPDPRAEHRQAVEEAFAAILSNSADLAPEALAAQSTELEPRAWCRDGLKRSSRPGSAPSGPGAFVRARIRVYPRP